MSFKLHIIGLLLCNIYLDIMRNLLCCFYGKVALFCATTWRIHICSTRIGRCGRTEVKVNTMYTLKKKKRQRKSSRKGCLTQGRDGTLFIRHQGGFREKKHDLKTQENMIQVCGNELSCGNIPNTDAYQGLCPGCCLGEQQNRRGSDLKEVARPLLTVNTCSEMTTKSPQTSPQWVSSAVFFLSALWRHGVWLFKKDWCLTGLV